MRVVHRSDHGKPERMCRLRQRSGEFWSSRLRPSYQVQHNSTRALIYTVAGPQIRVRREPSPRVPSTGMLKLHPSRQRIVAKREVDQQAMWGIACGIAKLAVRLRAGRQMR